MDAVVKQTSVDEMILAIEPIREVKAIQEASTPSMFGGKRHASTASKTVLKKSKTIDEQNEDVSQSPPPGQVPRHCTGGKKNMAKNLRSPSPGSPSSAADEDDTRSFIDEGHQRKVTKQARRAERQQHFVEGVEAINKKIKELVWQLGALSGEEKSQREQQEALREQLRAIDDKLDSLDRRKRSLNLKMQKYEALLSKFNEINSL